MNIYRSKYLTIDKRKDVLISEWTGESLTTNVFQEELKKYFSISEKVKPTSNLWLQEKLPIRVPVELHEWVTENIINPQFDWGLRKLAFTIPEDQYVNLSVVNFFNKPNQLIYPNYFLTEETAFDFCKKNKSTQKEIHSPFNDIEIEDNIKNASIKINIEPQNLSQAIKYLGKFKDQFQFKKNHQKKFNLLTSREREIFFLICAGFSNEEIAIRIHISKATVTTHRRNINRKLDIKTRGEWILYSNAFI